MIEVDSCKSDDFISTVKHPLFDSKRGIPHGYLASNFKFCDVNGLGKFGRMMTKTNDAMKAKVSLGVGAFIRNNKDELKNHVFGMMSYESRKAISAIPFDNSDLPNVGCTDAVE